METLKKYKWYIIGSILGIFVIYLLTVNLSSYLQNREESYIKSRKELTQQIKFAQSISEDWKNKYDSISVEKQKVKIIKIKQLYAKDSVKVSRGLISPTVVIGVDDSCLSTNELKQVAMTYFERDMYKDIALIQDTIIDTLEYKISVADSIIDNKDVQIDLYKKLDTISQVKIQDVNKDLKKQKRELLKSKIANGFLAAGVAVSLGTVLYMAIKR